LEYTVGPDANRIWIANFREKHMSDLSSPRSKSGVSLKTIFERLNGEVFLNYPLLTSLFVTDFALLSFGREPLLLRFLLLAGLVYLAMFFSAKSFVSGSSAEKQP
jgi:hypothetical protein